MEFGPMSKWGGGEKAYKVERHLASFSILHNEPSPQTLWHIVESRRATKKASPLLTGLRNDQAAMRDNLHRLYQRDCSFRTAGHFQELLDQLNGLDPCRG